MENWESLSTLPISTGWNPFSREVTCIGNTISDRDTDNRSPQIHKEIQEREAPPGHSWHPVIPDASHTQKLTY